MKYNSIFKSLLVMQFAFFFSSCSTVNKIPGTYLPDKNAKDIFVKLNKDSTFVYSWGGDMQIDKPSGWYSTKGDTVYMKFRPSDSLYQDSKAFKLATDVTSAVTRLDTLLFHNNKLSKIENGRVSSTYISKNGNR